MEVTGLKSKSVGIFTYSFGKTEEIREIRLDLGIGLVPSILRGVCKL